MLKSNINSKSKKSYDDLSSFLDDEEDELTIDESKSESNKDDSENKPKTISAEDLAIKKARIIEGTNFDYSYRKSKKRKSKKKSKK